MYMVLSWIFLDEGNFLSFIRKQKVNTYEDSTVVIY